MSPSPIDLTFFVPCLNEESVIHETLTTIRDAMEELPFSYEVIVVDDGSTDATAEVVRQFACQNPHLDIFLHRNPRNLGLAHSYVDTAFRGRGTYYFLACGDGGWSKETLIDIVSHMGEADIVLPYFTELTGKPLTRRILSRTYTFLVNRLSGNSIRYYNGGALCLRYLAMRWAPHTSGFFELMADMTTHLIDHGATYVEVPIKVWHVQKSQANSVVTLRNFFSVFNTLVNIFIRRLRKTIFGVPFQLSQLDVNTESMTSRMRAVDFSADDYFVDAQAEEPVLRRQAA